tara:strand:+ start:84543 stop:84863 length:321 start_codon:yes stop_codon:yes gene_type:complete
LFKSFFNNLFEKKLFKEITLELHMIDGSVVITDPIKYKKFKELINRRVNGEEMRIANENDYKEAYEDLQYKIKTPCDADFFSVSIRGKTQEISSKNIVKIIQHKKG